MTRLKAVLLGTVTTVLLANASAAAESADAPPIGGLYEVAIGVTDPVAQIRYWERFGYRVGGDGQLTAEEALRLYGVDSRLRSVRLLHQDADHGLLRLMIWDQPRNEGLGMTHMKVVGNRWAAALTSDLYNVFNHAEVARLSGQPIYYIEPRLSRIPIGDGAATPFVDPLFNLREIIMIQPLTRQVVFQRFGYVRPLYGKIDPDAFFPTSQVTHVGLMIQGGPELLRFYDDVLGLLRTGDDEESTYEDTVERGRNPFEIEAGERYFLSAFDDPRSSPQFDTMRSGRLIVVRFPESVRVEDKRASSRPGSLGMSLYTFRVRDLDAYHARIKASAATDVSPIVKNEFGERSFSFTAPDGYVWTLLE
jgi:catechol 2,3-dioxygenase-like lactoylglutathione lyase family enzyme